MAAYEAREEVLHRAFDAFTLEIFNLPALIVSSIGDLGRLCLLSSFIPSKENEPSPLSGSTRSGEREITRGSASGVVRGSSRQSMYCTPVCWKRATTSTGSYFEGRSYGQGRDGTTYTECTVVADARSSSGHAAGEVEEGEATTDGGSLVFDHRRRVHK